MGEVRKNSVVVISQVENGFTVSTSSTVGLFEHGASVSPNLVFNSMTDLLGWMEDHFDHRAECVSSDICGDADAPETRQPPLSREP